jgi:hypothetical protein
MRIVGVPTGIKKGLVLGMIAAAMLGTAVYAADAPAEDPAALAATYEKQAADLRASADKHENMAKMHKGGAGSSKVNHESIVRHCDKIAEALRAAAQESDALAKDLRTGANK